MKWRNVTHAYLFGTNVMGWRLFEVKRARLNLPDNGSPYILSGEVVALVREDEGRDSNEVCRMLAEKFATPKAPAHYWQPEERVS